MFVEQFVFKYGKVNVIVLFLIDSSEFNALSVLKHRLLSNILLVGSQKLVSLIFTFFRRDKKTELLLLGVSYIAECQTELYLVKSKFTVIVVLNFQ